METYRSGSAAIRIDQYEPSSSSHAGLLLLHGSGGAASSWLERFAPMLVQFGVAVYAPHYFDKTGTRHATAETILDGRHFGEWLPAARDAIHYIAARPAVDPKRIGVLGISLGGYLAIALAAEQSGVRAVIEISGGLPPGWEGRISPAMPPVLVVHGAQDDVVPVAEACKLKDLLDRHQVPCQLEILPAEGHWFSSASRPALLMTCAGFLSRHL